MGVNYKLLTTIEVYIMLITGVILLVCNSVVLVHIRLGNKNKWLTWVVCLLLVSNFGNLLMAYSYQTLFVERIYTPLNCAAIGLGDATKFWGFSISHFLLADKYRTISKKMPAIFDGKPEVPPTRTENFIWWALFVWNFVSPWMLGFFSFIYANIVYVKGEPGPPALLRFNASLIALVGAC